MLTGSLLYFLTFKPWYMAPVTVKLHLCGAITPSKGHHLLLP